MATAHIHTSIPLKLAVDADEAGIKMSEVLRKHLPAEIAEKKKEQAEKTKVACESLDVVSTDGNASKNKQPMVIEKDVYNALDSIHQSLADALAKKGLVKIVM